MKPANDWLSSRMKKPQDRMKHLLMVARKKKKLKSGLRKSLKLYLTAGPPKIQLV